MNINNIKYISILYYLTNKNYIIYNFLKFLNNIDDIN